MPSAVVNVCCCLASTRCTCTVVAACLHVAAAVSIFTNASAYAQLLQHLGSLDSQVQVCLTCFTHACPHTVIAPNDALPSWSSGFQFNMVN